MNTPSATFQKLALALTLTCFLAPNAFAATDAQDSNQYQKLLDRGQIVVGSEQQTNGHKWVTAKILINATPHVVWETVHEERKHDPDLAYSKVLSSKDDQAMLEQRFALIPVIGTATCVMHNHEIPNQRIDYDMVSSDHFKALEGSWVITPAKESGSSYLQLSSYCDMGLPVPRAMIDGITARKLQRRLANVKAMAEAAQLRVASHKI